MSGFGNEPIPGLDDTDIVSSPVLTAPDQRWGMRLLNGPLKGRILPVITAPTLIGRSDPPDLRVDIDLTEAEVGTPAMVSRKHARIDRDPVDGTLRLLDLGSTNGTWLDDKRLEPQAISTPIILGARVRFANLEADFVSLERHGG